MAVSRGCQHPFYYFFILNRSVLVKNYTVFLYKVINLQGNQDICNEKDQEAKTGKKSEHEGQQQGQQGCNQFFTLWLKY